MGHSSAMEIVGDRHGDAVNEELLGKGAENARVGGRDRSSPPSEVPSMRPHSTVASLALPLVFFACSSRTDGAGSTDQGFTVSPTGQENESRLTLRLPA